MSTRPYAIVEAPSTLTLNAKSIAAWLPKLADVVATVLDAGEFPLVLGGDCTILLGTMLAPRRRGRLERCITVACEGR